MQGRVSPAASSRRLEEVVINVVWQPGLPDSRYLIIACEKVMGNLKGWASEDES